MNQALGFVFGAVVFAAHPLMAAEPEVSVLRQGREGLVRCAFSSTEDMVVQVRDLVNEWVYIVPRDLPTAEFGKGDLVHAGPDDYPAIHLGDFGFMSGNHGSYFVHVQTVPDHGLTAEAVGASVTHESGEPFVIVGIPDANHLLLHPEGRPGADPGFKYLPRGRFRCGERTWTPRETTREQLWPMSRYRGFRWQLADGTEAPDGREVRSSRIDLVLEHDVLDPRGVVRYLKTHPGRTGHAFGIAKAYALVDTPTAAVEAGDFMEIPSLMTVKTTYRYDGRCCRQVLRRSTFNAPIRQASALDVCYCWDQGERKWENVELYAPRMKPVTLKGKEGGADVVCDLTAVAKMSYPPWKVNTNLMRTDSTDPANPPDRFIRRLSRGSRHLGVALGYSLVNGVSALGNGWPHRDRLYHFWDTGKMYPYVMSLYAVKAGTTYEHCAYTQFFNPDIEPDATDFYCHREGDRLIVYADFHKTLKAKRLRLPQSAAGRTFEVLEKTPSVTVGSERIAPDGTVTLDVAGGYGTLVLAVSLTPSDSTGGIRNLQPQIDAAAAAGGGTVRVGSGEIEVQPFVLRSGVTLELAKGTVLLASTNLADYASTHAFVYAEDADGVSIVGEGTLCGRGWAFKEKEGLSGESQPSEQVPILARFSRCRNVRLEDFTFRDGAAWGVHLRNCDGVTVRRVKAFSHTNESNDGLDVESRNVLIEGCDIDADDDALVIKSESDPSFDIFNIEVRNCTFRSCCNAIKFGTGSYGYWHDVDIHDCAVERAGKSWRFDWRKPSCEWPQPNGNFPKAMPGVTNAVTGLAAIALEVVDGGRMERVKVRNIDIRSGVMTPVFIRMGRRHPRPDELPTYLRNVLIENVKGRAESRIACSITGLPYARPTDITLRNVDLSFPGGGTADEAAKAPRECETDYPDCYMFDQEALPAWGFYVRHADNIRFENVKLALNTPDARPMVVREDVKDFSWDDAPEGPGPENWGFRKDLSEPEQYPAARVGGSRTAWMKTRISRCFFSPIKRPPFNRDELADDVDYYPEAYLDRLEREGVNGLWLTIRWRDLAETSFAKRAPDAPKKLAKLRRTVEKCLRHGIRTYVFFIEPIYATVDDPFLKEHPELFGEPCEGMCVMCASRPQVRRYIEESVRDIFTQVPGLGGALAITHGERPTTCFSWIDATDGSRQRHCPACDRLEPWQLHNLVAESVVKGMRAAGSDGDFISWLYQPYAASGRDSWVAECARHLPEGVILQYNFESGAERDQLGKVRHGGDYWLSYAGPSEAFRAIAEAGRAAGGRIGAKTQVCNSHEMATVPYVPVPGLLYRKYRAMRDLGVSEVMQCWYFGSYPGVMNRAAGELAFEDFADGEDAFLERLAAADWGSDAKTVAGLWKRLSDAYANYPLSNNMQYYGPFAAGVAWPLRPDVDLAPLARTWKPLDPPSGDLIGECLENHSLAEARELASRMVRLSELPGIEALAGRWKENGARTLDIGVMKALALHFRSAFDIFDFYAARAEAVFASRCDGDTGKSLAALMRMEEAIRREERVTREMLPLVRDDSRLGFHSEAEAYQYHPARLEWRLGKLERAIGRIGEIREIVSKGGAYPESPFERNAPSLTVGGGETSSGNGYRIRVDETADGGLTFTIRTPDLRPLRLSTLDALGLSVYRTYTFDAEGKAYDRTINRVAPNHVVRGNSARRLANGGYELVFTLSAEGWGNDVRMRPGWMQLQVGDTVDQWDFAPAWPERAFAEPRLNLRNEISDFARLRFGRSPRPADARAVTSEGTVDRKMAEDVLSKGRKMSVWPKGRMPGKAEGPAFRVQDTDEGVVRLTDVTVPELAFFPAKGEGSSPAVLVCPGGAYHHLAYSLEGTEIAEWLNACGFSAFVLRYRCPDRRELAFEDAQRALSVIRSRADECSVDPRRIGVMGFSAGAHLAARLSTGWRTRSYAPVDSSDGASCRPDFMLLIYPGLLTTGEPDEKTPLLQMRSEFPVDDETPSAFLVQCEDDFASVENALACYAALKRADVKAEMHLFASGGHGYGIRKRGEPVDGWEVHAEKWLSQFAGTGK